jgi:hypothetical protein
MELAFWVIPVVAVDTTFDSRRSPKGYSNVTAKHVTLTENPYSAADRKRGPRPIDLLFPLVLCVNQDLPVIRVFFLTESPL